MGTEQAVILMLVGVIILLGACLLSLWGAVGNIQNNCNFDKGGTEKIRQDLEIVMHQVDFLIHGDKGGLKILIYDDDKESANQLAECINLINKDTRIKISTNIQNARYQLNHWRPETVFADCMHNNEEYGTIFKAVMEGDKSPAKLILYSGGEKPEKYDGIFLDKMEIMKNPDILKEYL